MSEIKTGLGISLQALQNHSKQAKQAETLANSNPKTEAEVEKAAAGFEALMLQELMQSMWSTVDEVGLLGENSNQGKIYRDMFHQAIADSVAEGPGIGIKKMLMQELLKR